MTTLRLRIEDLVLSPGLRRVRNQAALVRTLLDELERVAPGGDADAPSSAVAQVAEELESLGQRMLQCASSIRDGRSPSDDYESPESRHLTR